MICPIESDTFALGNPTPVLALTLLILSVGVAVSSVEWLFLWRSFSRGGVYSSRPVSAFRQLFLPAGLRAPVEAPWAFAVVMVVRLACSLYCLADSHSLPVVPILLLTASQLFLHIRCRYGMEGADQMTAVLLISLSTTVADVERLASVTIPFIAVQSILSYTIAGVSKLFGKLWINGTAVKLVLRTKGFGNPLAWHMLSRSRVAAVLATYAVLAFECTFPAVLVLPHPFQYAYVIAGIIFHAGNSVLMGLNQFFWAFTASYPSVLACSYLVSSWLWG